MAMPAWLARSSIASRSKSRVRAGFDGEASRAGLNHGFDGADTDHRHIEAHVLVGLGHLHNGQTPLEDGRRGRELLHRATASACRRAQWPHRCLPWPRRPRRPARRPRRSGRCRSRPRPWRHPSHSRCSCALLRRGARSVRHAFLASRGSRNAVELISSMPSSASTLATAPSSMSVLRVRRFRSSLARRQSGRMLREDLFVLHLAGHDGHRDAFLVEGLDEPREFA